MIKDAEQHANEDAKEELVETRNMAEGIVTSTEKMLEENKDKATEEEVTAINEANDKLKKLLENEDLSIDDLKNGIDELAKASQSFAEKLYAEAQNDTTNPSSDGQMTQLKVKLQRMSKEEESLIEEVDNTSDDLQQRKK